MYVHVYFKIGQYLSRKESNLNGRILGTGQLGGRGRVLQGPSWYLPSCTVYKVHGHI